MALYRFGERVPRIDEGACVSDSARVIGDVVVGAGCYIGHGAILHDTKVGDLCTGQIDCRPVSDAHRAPIHFDEVADAIGPEMIDRHGPRVHRDCRRLDCQQRRARHAGKPHGRSPAKEGHDGAGARPAFQ